MGQKRTASKRGTMSARHWADIRQAARLVRTEGVMLTLHGIEIHPPRAQAVRSSQSSAGKAVEKKPEPEDDGQQPMETVASNEPSKSQQRSARRLAEFIEKKRAARWSEMVQNALRLAREKLRADTWTAWMRSRLARAKLRKLLWRACQARRCWRA